MTDQPSDPLLTPQAIVTFACLAIGAGSIAAGFVLGDAQMKGMSLAAGIGALAAAYGYWLGSSKGSADKTAALAASVPVTNTTTQQ